MPLVARKVYGLPIEHLRLPDHLGGFLQSKKFVCEGNLPISRYAFARMSRTQHRGEQNKRCEEQVIA
jgi:hypothetical protein